MDKQFIRLLGLRSRRHNDVESIRCQIIPKQDQSWSTLRCACYVEISVYRGIASSNDATGSRKSPILDNKLSKKRRYESRESKRILDRNYLSYIRSLENSERRAKSGKRNGRRRRRIDKLERRGDYVVIRMVGGSEIRLKGSVGREYGGINPVFRFIIGRA